MGDLCEDDNNICISEYGRNVYAGTVSNGQCKSFTGEYITSFATDVISLAGKSNYLFTGSQNYIKSYDISNPANPILLDTLYIGHVIYDLYIEQNALVAAAGNGIAYISTINPSNLQIVEFNQYLTGAWDIVSRVLYVSKDNIHISADNYGVNMIWIDQNLSSTSNKITYLSRIINSSSIKDVEVMGNTLYFIDSVGVISVYDITDITNPVYENSAYYYCSDSELFGFNGRMFAACNGNNIIEIVNQNGSISFINSTGDPVDLKDAYIYNEYIFLPDNDGSIRVNGR